MTCPHCGLLNSSNAKSCVHCKTQLPAVPKMEAPANRLIGLNRIKSRAAVTGAGISQSRVSPHFHITHRQRVPDLKSDGFQVGANESQPIPAENLLNDFRNRELSRPGKRDLPKGSKPTRTTPPNSERIERIEINLTQGTLPFDAVENSIGTGQEDHIPRGLMAAPIAARMRAGAIDALFVSGCFLIFLMIVFFIPEFVFFSKSSFLGLTVVSFLIVNSYLFLLTAVSAQTLGMDQEHLQVINFKGQAPSLRETYLRSFGYFISLGCFCLGFLWAVFDPEKLTWHDRISSTLIIQKET